MTPDEFCELAEVAILQRQMKIWEVYDLRLVMRQVRRKAVVHSTDTLILKLSGRALRYSPELPSPKPPPDPKKAVQQGLF